MPQNTGSDTAVWLARTEALIDQTHERLAAAHQARQLYQRTLAMLIQAPGAAPAYWLKLGSLDAAAWQAGKVSLPPCRLRVGECYMAYANGAGAVGMLEVTSRGAQWRLRLPTLRDAVVPAALRDTLGLRHPSRQVVALTPDQANGLHDMLVYRLLSVQT